MTDVQFVRASLMSKIGCWRAIVAEFLLEIGRFRRFLSTFYVNNLNFELIS
jgi:hypothetical protein